jgi:hypothetical protein
MNRLFSLFLLASSLAAQTAPTGVPSRLYEPKYLGGSRLAVVCRLVREMVADTSCTPEPELRAVVLTSKTPELLATAEGILKRYDVPEPAAPRTPEASFTIYLVRASSTPPDHPRPLPSELDPVIAEMKRLFTYENYSLLDTILMPPQTTEIESMIPGAQFNGTPYFYNIRKAGGTQVDAQAKTVRVPTLVFNLRIPYQSGNDIKQGTSSISTGINIQEGQKLVLGKVKLDYSPNTDVFLVLTVKLQ